ncbi:MAG: two-component sensor histidine kinase [Thiobacillus sp.]|nr:two-component sensor histidine kinase [Thiobacillus sp.]
MRQSIQARVLVPVMLAVLVVGLVTAWLAYQRAVHEVDELFDAQLSQYVRIMLALAHDRDDDEVAPPHIHGHRYESRMLFQIWQYEHGRPRLLIRSPDSPLAWPEGVARDGYSQVRIGDRVWRSFAAADEDGELLAWAALDLDIRDHLAGDIAKDNLRPYLYGLPILALVLWLAIRQGLAPLRRLETELASRSPDRLDSLPEAGLARELNPLVRTLNRLFGRVGKTIENERRFTSDAAHELRTPLAALRVQLQVAQRTPDEAERRSAIDKALLGAGRMAHLVIQLLSLARLESSGTAGEMRPVDLNALAGEVVADLVGMATDKGVELELDTAGAGQVRGNPDLLRVLVRNLVDNALRYTPAGGRVLVSLAGHVLRVADNGPGVESAGREKLGLRFHRFGPQSAEGVGLGLSIVRRIAELHGATVNFRDGLEGAGLTVEVAF